MALSQFNTGWSGDIDRLDAVKIGGQGGEQMGILGAGDVSDPWWLKELLRLTVTISFNTSSVN